MNLILDILPTTVNIDGQEFRIKSNFRELMLFELLMQDNNIPNNEKVFRALSLFFIDEFPSDVNKAVDEMLWFYRCGEYEEPLSANGEEGSSITPKRIYSYEHDAKYIYSAFLSQYGIDLQDIKYLHWWKFKAMFDSLHEDQKFVKIMEYRATNINSEMSKDQKDFYRKMKKLYALPDNRTEAQKEAEFHESLAKLI